MGSPPRHARRPQDIASRRRAMALGLAGLGTVGCSDAFDDPVETEVGDAEICDSVRTWESAWVEWEADVVRELDAARAQMLACGDVPQKRQRALYVIPELTCAARLQARELADIGELSHRGPGGDFVGRADVAGYEGVPTAELLAVDVDSPPKVVERWLDQADACAAILGPPDDAIEPRAYADEVGVALFRDPGDQRPHWVVALGQNRE